MRHLSRSTAVLCGSFVFLMGLAIGSSDLPQWKIRDVFSNKEAQAERFESEKQLIVTHQAVKEASDSLENAIELLTKAGAEIELLRQEIERLHNSQEQSGTPRP